MKKSINYNIFEKLENFAPLKFAESWDNVGMLVEPENDVKIHKILLTNDLTHRVMDEAIVNDVQMIISYHPPIFNALKHIRQNSWKESLITKCIKRDIYVYSPHTAFDVINGGINDWIISIFDVKCKQPIEPFKGDCSDHTSLSNGDDKSLYGAGRICELTAAISLDQAVNLLKKRFKLPNLLVAQPRRSDTANESSMIRTIAVCTGSGASLLKSCRSRVDLWVTGEMSHHDLLDATENVDAPTAVILTAGHSNSERGFLTDVFQPWLINQLQADDVEVIVSATDADPLVVV